MTQWRPAMLVHEEYPEFAGRKLALHAKIQCTKLDGDRKKPDIYGTIKGVALSRFGFSGVLV